MTRQPQIRWHGRFRPPSLPTAPRTACATMSVGSEKRSDRGNSRLEIWSDEPPGLSLVLVSGRIRGGHMRESLGTARRHPARTWRGAPDRDGQPEGSFARDGRGRQQASPGCLKRAEDEAGSEEGGRRESSRGAACGTRVDPGRASAAVRQRRLRASQSAWVISPRCSRNGVAVASSGARRRKLLRHAEPAAPLVSVDTGTGCSSHLGCGGSVMRGERAPPVRTAITKVVRGWRHRQRVGAMPRAGVGGAPPWRARPRPPSRMTRSHRDDYSSGGVGAKEGPRCMSAHGRRCVEGAS